MGRRDEVLDAAVEVLATGGTRGFSHRACDAAAGVPPGTTSNHFRTRHDLLMGTLGRLVERGLVEKWRAKPNDPVSEAGLVRSLAAAVRNPLADHRHELIAGAMLYFEAVGDADLATSMRPHAERSFTTVEDELAALGAEDPESGGKLLRGFMLAVVLAQYADGGTDFDPEPLLEPLVRGLLH